MALNEIGYSSATERIDPARLGPRNNKRVLAASVFGDVVGFTARVDQALTLDDYRELIRDFHMIRKEMREVVVTDFGAVRIQYQGDRIQGLLHLPEDDTNAIARGAVDIGVGLQSSMEYVLNDHLESPLHLAVGIDMGTTLVSNLGIRGRRDVICVGNAPARASKYEDAVGAGELCISADVHDELDDEVGSLFAYDAHLRAWIAKDLTQLKLDAIAEADLYKAGEAVTVSGTGKGIRISDGKTTSPSPGRVTPAKPWAE